ncbi:MAG: sterol desaturase family protein, partial [Flavobacteriales bacterium]
MLSDAHNITVKELMNMDLPPVIHYAAPIMFALVGLEFVINQYQQRSKYIGKEFLASSAIGIGNLIVTAFIKVGIFAFILFFYNLVPWRIPNTWWAYPLCLIAIDFCRYWGHRFGHEQRFWWATHVTHHSSENYNFLVSFRLSWIQHLKVVFFVPVALMGFDPIVFFVCHQIEVLYQFWIHTEYIRKLPRPIEYIFTTPSHHRVHHAVNPHYLDKNYGSTFIIWDRIFGTFEPEVEEPVYGIVEPVNTFNPVYLVFHEFVDMIKDVWRSKSLKEAWLMVFGRPRDMA